MSHLVTSAWTQWEKNAIKTTHESQFHPLSACQKTNYSLNSKVITNSEDFKPHSKDESSGAWQVPQDLYNDCDDLCKDQATVSSLRT